ncbi:MAG TPA: M20/M25/M40 family metallo-hydrolase [Holophagaceae bacterium]|nr:M20/M25/M40 family metallo-hydrolase [Holophagaceae bacterium]HJW33197.1 M20/M25/M40 family metallo-hydrolase [Holophagaceae bacterium]
MPKLRILHALLVASALLGAGSPKELLKATDQRGAYEVLKSLTQEVGPRLAGSPQDAAAHAWAAARFKAMGLSAVRTEEVPLGRTWIRGREEARLGDRILRVTQMGWTPGTPAPVKAPLALLPAAKARGDLAEFKGRIVLAGEPLRELDPPQMQAPLRAGRAPKPHADFPMGKALPALIQAGAQAVLMDSGKSGELLTMDGGAVNTTAPSLPIAFVSHGDYLRLAEAAASGAELELFLGGAFGPAGRTFNTVAELRGSGKPGECVILGAHLDSWDLATGAMDNGAGVASVMEAARLLIELKRPPRRTVRFVLFGAEEQGYLGSAAYVASIRKDLGKVSGVFIMDTGGGAVDGVALQGRRKVAPTMLKIVAPLRPLGVVDTDLRMESGTDHIPFHTAGVPAFCLEQKQHTYARDHHSEADTLDKVDPAELQQCAVVMAWLGWKVADLPGLLPR